MKTRQRFSFVMALVLSFLPAVQAHALVNSLNGQTGLTQTFANDTNVRITSAGNVHTLGWNGTLSVARGGTGAGSFTANAVIFGNGTGSLQATAAPSAGQLLVGNASGVPSFATMSGDATLASSGALTIAANAVALGPDTTGNYVATIAGSSQITVTGSGSESAAVTLAIASNSIGAAQLNVTTSPSAGDCLLFDSGNSLKWDDCPAGPQGPQGDPGPQGPAGATGAQGPAGASGFELVVVDSQDEEVGYVIDSNLTVRFTGTYWVTMQIDPIGFRQANTNFGSNQQGSVSMLYLSNDCSGTAYVLAGGMTRFGQTSGTKVYFPADPVQVRSFLSSRNSPPDNLGSCNPMSNAFVQLSGPMEYMDVSSFTPPFTIAPN